MSAERLFSLRNPWFATALAITGSIAVASAAAGFLWFPSLQTNARFAGMWDAICSAAGLVRAAPLTAPAIEADMRMTRVVVTPQMLGGASALSIGHGATLALQCTMCHGARGVSEADSPNLAGQFAPAIYKQLQDYKSGARTSGIMGPRVANLTEQDMRDLAAYYAYLPRVPGYHPAAVRPAPRIVASGAPMRNIPPCAACHGGLETKTGAAWLEGEPPAYLRTQLAAFASGARHNDISQQMRNIARGLTAAEIEEAVQYYANQP